jgi:hypothetical protein
MEISYAMPCNVKIIFDRRVIATTRRHFKADIIRDYHAINNRVLLNKVLSCVYAIRARKRVSPIRGVSLLNRSC